ncbi:hypothetical protein A9Q99_12070 [Gammaproteobacteria bacterium 45_16_T64]|mgnify:CR=1 FL=1|nr:hypothetical protein A9Q99_12070 [Gammaproteobacteria bacterium 45_16_T64]
MLKCKEVSELSSDYVDRRLPWRQRAGIVWHIFLCVHCRRYIRYFRLTIFVSKKAATPPPDHVVDSVMDRIAKDTSDNPPD